MPVEINIDSGVTMAVLSCLKDGEWWSTNDLVQGITEAGRKTSQQEISGVMVTLRKGDVGNMLEVDTSSKAHAYRLVEPYTQATLLELRDCYLKRVRDFSHRNLLEKYGSTVPEKNAGAELDLVQEGGAVAPPIGESAGLVQVAGPGSPIPAPVPRVILVEVNAGEVVTIIVRGKGN